MKTRIIKLDHQGMGIGYYNNKVVFIPYTLIDEEIEFETLKEKEKYIEARLVKIINPSPGRIKNDCPYFGICGGCQLLHMSYSDELKYKYDKIKNIVKRYGKYDYLVEDIIGSERFEYRNKITLQASDKIGFYKNKSNDIIEIKKCLLINNKMNSVIDTLINEKKPIQIRYSSYNEDIMINDKSNYIIDKIGKYSFKISPESFFQINYKQVDNLYNKVLEYAKLNKEDKVLDLYCGIGTISIYISEYCKEVIGVEINEKAIQDALENKKINKINNVDFINSDTSKLITKNDYKPNVVIVDPPRSGLTSKVKNDIIKLNPDKIVYVSCDPMTLIRDLNDFSDKYKIDRITPIDMFPGTYHIECVVKMIIKK